MFGITWVDITIQHEDKVLNESTFHMSVIYLEDIHKQDKTCFYIVINLKLYMFLYSNKPVTKLKIPFSAQL